VRKIISAAADRACDRVRGGFRSGGFARHRGARAVRIKLDENLPESLLATLADLRHNVDNVRSEGLSGQTDADVWQEAQKAERFLITQDLDFSDIRKFSPGTHHGLMLVRLRVPASCLPS
jgi:hypothetical protein